MESHEPNRTRTRNLVIRLNDYEREALDRAAERNHMSISETVRYLIRRDEELSGSKPAGRVSVKAQAAKPKRRSA